MAELALWLNAKSDLPVPLCAAIAHYSCDHSSVLRRERPYSRLLTTLILHRDGYGMNGIYSLEEYYAKDLSAYYGAISVGPSHNYHLGRAEADIAGWIAYLLPGMAEAFERVHAHAKKSAALAKAPKSPANRLNVKEAHCLGSVHGC